MNILITGASGLVGCALSEHLRRQGHHVMGLSRRKNAQGDYWDPDGEIVCVSDQDPIDVVIHLAGENVASGRWTEAKKDRILKSRVQGTQTICRYLAQLEHQPKLLISASGVGYYGHGGDASLDEASPLGSQFLSGVCEQWEQATEPASDAGIRVVHARLGMVLSSHGGALAKMLPPFRWGLGGVIGSGQQYMSWISLDDLVGVFEWLFTDDTLSGPINVVAPQAVTNTQFTKVLGKVLGRVTVIPMPTFLAKLLFGEMADELLLTSCRAEPVELRRSGYPFKHPKLEQALSYLISEENPSNPKSSILSI
jgi:uncharacterized protein (TIGR01777 family)